MHGVPKANFCIGFFSQRRLLLALRLVCVGNITNDMYPCVKRIFLMNTIRFCKLMILN